MAIDNPLEKIRAITNEDENDPLGGFLHVAGVAHPLFAIASVAKSLLDAQQRWERIRAGLRALCDELERIRERWPNDLESAIHSDWFKRGLNVLIEESARAINDDHARLLGRVAAQGSFPADQDRYRQEDLAIYIRDLAQLGTDDVGMLRLLGRVHKDAVKPAPSRCESPSFRAGFDRYRRAVTEEKIDLDDALSLCERLRGFGLASEVPRFDTVQGPDEQMFRPTRRGIYLLSLLQAAELPLSEQD